MRSTVQIENELPNALRITGSQFADTQMLTMQEVTLFIERDVFCHLKSLPALEPRHSVMLLKQDGRFQVSIAVQITQQSAVEFLREQIENLVWAYNQQVFIPKKGLLYPCPPRFALQLEVVCQEGGAYAQRTA